MKLKSYRYKHEKFCSGTLEQKAVKPFSKPRATPKPKAQPIIQEVEETPKFTQPVSNQILKPQPRNPLTDITNHYQILHQQYIQQKKEKYDALCKNMFSTKMKNNIIMFYYNFIIMAVNMDGHTSVIGTEFIKLLNTGTSDLATEEYVDNAVANGGGGGGGGSGDGYSQAEVDALLNAKLSANNPQDILGTLRIDSANGNGKIVINALGAPNDEDFYVNGLSNLGGTLKCQLLQASSNIETSQQIQSNITNTYSNSNMILQRNAVNYITLDRQVVDTETVEKIILHKDVEFSGNLSLNAISVDTISTNRLNDMVFNVDPLGEFLRFYISDFTVRVPDNRRFLSKNIIVDNIQPLAFANDIVFNGGNSTNDAFEEYIRSDASTETVDISKNVNCHEALILKLNKVLNLDNTTAKERHIYAFEDSDHSVLSITNARSDGTKGQIPLINAGFTSMIIDSSFVFTPRQIRKQWFKS